MKQFAFQTFALEESLDIPHAGKRSLRLAIPEQRSFADTTRRLAELMKTQKFELAPLVEP